MTELEKQICEILKKRFHCLCHLCKPPYCISVAELVNLFLSFCEEEETEL